MYIPSNLHLSYFATRYKLGPDGGLRFVLATMSVLAGGVVTKHKYIHDRAPLRSAKHDFVALRMHHVVFSCIVAGAGRNAAQEVIDRAHTVTELREIKHAYRQKIEPQKGIDY
jgi:hypothetical protein